MNTQVPPIVPNKGEIIIYQDKRRKTILEVRLEEVTVWLNLDTQGRNVFGRAD